MAGVAFVVQEVAPYLYPFIVCKFGMVDRQFVPEHPLQTGGKLCGESYFGNKVENLSALFQYRVDEMYVYLGLSARRNAV